MYFVRRASSEDDILLDKAHHKVWCRSHGKVFNNFKEVRISSFHSSIGSVRMVQASIMTNVTQLINLSQIILAAVRVSFLPVISRVNLT